MDPTTGRRTTPIVKQERTRPRLAADAGGQRIGYTTFQVAPHVFTLPDLFSASDDLLTDGYSLVRVNALRAENLQGIDKLVVGLLGATLPDEDVDAIEAFVRGGGDLVYLGENNLFFNDINTQVAGRFGIQFPTSDPPQVVLMDTVDHPVTRGPFGTVEQIVGTSNKAGFFGSMSSPGPYGTGIVRFPAGNSAAVVLSRGAFAPGSGSVIAFAEINIFFNTYGLGDNRALWRNAFAYDPPLTRVALGFETEDDFATELVNGQAVRAPETFGRLVSIQGTGAFNFGAAVFDSTPDGPNADASDADLLVDRGNVLILQENGQETVPGIYDDPDDSWMGGTLVFDFPSPVLAEAIDLIDICPGPPAQDVTVTLFDELGATRSYSVPGGWTDDVSHGGPGFGTLSLLTLDPQPGVAATAVAAETPGFLPSTVVRMEVELASSGAVDNLVIDFAPVPFGVVACSLGCADAGPGAITCAITDVFVNQEVEFTFSQRFDLSSVSLNTLQVVEVETGTTPPGVFDIAPGDERTLLWRPRLTFDSAGNPIFGLNADSTYFLRMPGSILDPLGPFITSRIGEPNRTRVACTLVASLGVFDVVPGPPVVGVRVGDGQLAQGSVDVPRDTDISFRFNDLMNPATLANPVTGTSTTITIEADLDGDFATLDDRLAIDGLYQLTLDQDGKETRLVFDPTDDLPAGVWIFVVTTSAIQDLAGNALQNAGELLFRTGQ